MKNKKEIEEILESGKFISPVETPYFLQGQILARIDQLEQTATNSRVRTFVALVIASTLLLLNLIQFSQVENQTDLTHLTIYQQKVNTNQLY
jgi:hypothetical protein